LLSRLAARSGGRIRAYPTACGDTAAKLQVAAPDEPTSQLNSLSSTKSNGKQVLIEVKRLDDVCTENGIERIDILKTDTEGFDAKVLMGASALLGAGKIRCVVSEVGFLDDKQHTPFTQIYDILTRNSFQFAGLFELTYLRDGGCDFGNAMFVRD
jgi:FkbM family methyltransferase